MSQDARRTVETRYGRVPLRDVGAGPVVLLVHGLLVDGALWDGTVDALGADVRCLVPELPLGAHREPADERTELTLEGVADLLGALLDELDVEDVTVVANDTGGAVAQLLLARHRHRQRIGRLVLTSCELEDRVPPRVLRGLVPAARYDGLVHLLVRAMASGAGRRVMARLFAPGADDRLLRRWFTRAVEDPAARADLGRLLRSLRRDALAPVVPAVRAWGGPVRLVWGGDDRLFMPLATARRFAAAVPRARLEVVPGARVLVPLQAPAAVARAVRDVLAEPPAPRLVATR